MLIAAAIAHGQDAAKALLNDATLKQYKDGLKSRGWTDYTYASGHWEATGWDPRARLG
jgi:hypothetical protein